MDTKVLFELLKRGGVGLAAAVALGWWAWHLDTVTRAERAAAEVSFRDERDKDRKAWTEAMRSLASACLSERRAAQASAVLPAVRRPREED